MKNNFAFLASWFPTLIFASFLSALGSGVIQMIFKFVIPDSERAQYLFAYFVLTAIICASLAIVSKKLGTQLNKGAVPLSTGVPVFNMLIAGVVYIALFLLMKGRALGFLYLFPCEMFFANGVLGTDVAVNAPVYEKVGFCIMQFVVYFAVSLAFYMITKKKQDNSEAVKKIRGEKKKPNNRFGIDIDI